MLLPKLFRRPEDAFSHKPVLVSTKVGTYEVPYIKDLNLSTYSIYELFRYPGRALICCEYSNLG